MNIQSSTILITGATGFLGSHLTRMLQEKASQVIVLKRKNSKLDRLISIKEAKNVIWCDVEDGLEAVFERSSINVIVHCAVEYGRTDVSCLNILSTNLIFPVSLVELAIKYKVKTFINTDSYFNKPTFSYKHLPNYSLSKKSFLLWLEHFSQSIQTVNVILEHIYGESDNQDKFVENAIQKIAINQDDNYPATYGEQKRDFIYVADVVSAYECIIQKSLVSKARHSVYNLGTGFSTSIHDFLNMIQKVSKSTSKINFGEKPYREDEIMLSVADNSSLLDLGWEPRVLLEDGIKKIITDYGLRAQ